jgi:phospholipase/carboxylesterase
MIELETGQAPQYSVIWMHGLGADGSDFEPIVPYLGLNPSVPVRFVFPNAPQIPVTCNGGFVMPAWYDIISLAAESREIDEAGLLASRDTIAGLIEREVARGIPADHIFLAGFSQGGAVAYLTGLSHKEPLAGIIALSTYIPSPYQAAQLATQASRSTPIYIAHGTHDDVVSLKLGEIARNTVAELGYTFDWQTYPMGHEVCLPEIQAIGAWINAQISNPIS